jgi:hypothetical protein
MLSRIAIKPAYAPEFQDWSEMDPGVSSATLKVPSPGALWRPESAVHAEVAMATKLMIEASRISIMAGICRQTVVMMAQVYWHKEA